MALSANFTNTPEALGAVEFGDIIANAEPSLGAGNMTIHGYTEYRVWITNRSSSQTHRLTLTLPETKYGSRGNLIREITQSAAVGPSSTVIVTLLQPPLPAYGNGLAVTIDGEPQDKGIPLNLSQSWRHSNTLLILISRSVTGDFQLTAKAVFGEPGTSTLPPALAQEKLEFLQSDLPVTDWSKNWLGYSSYDGIVVTPEDLQTMPDPILSALQSYVESGGSLLVMGSWEVPENWRKWQETKLGLSIYYVGFGVCVISPSTNVKRFDTMQWQLIRDRWVETFKPWQSYWDVTQAHIAFPVVKNLTIPVRGLFLLMVLFVLIIGPINLFLLTRKGKRIWLLWTVPVISLVTSMTVSAYAFLTEGWRAYVRTEGLTILDEASHRATTIGWAAFYAPLTPSDGLRFGYETELTPQLGTSWSGGTSRTLDWSRDQHLAVGWITARVPAYFMVRKSEMRRERLVIKGESNKSLTVINGLGAHIQDLRFADAKGKIYSATDIPAGVQAVLEPVSSRASNAPDALRRIFNSDWIKAIENFFTNTDTFLRPGCYIALLNSSPFIEEGIQNVQSRKTQTVVYGIIENQNED
jgi:hypothetical protein